MAELKLTNPQIVLNPFPDHNASAIAARYVMDGTTFCYSAGVSESGTLGRLSHSA